jgi:hypothetical protein
MATLSLKRKRPVEVRNLAMSPGRYQLQTTRMEIRRLEIISSSQDVKIAQLEQNMEIESSSQNVKIAQLEQDLEVQKQQYIASTASIMTYVQTAINGFSKQLHMTQLVNGSKQKVMEYRYQLLEQRLAQSNEARHKNPVTPVRKALRSLDLHHTKAGIKKRMPASGSPLSFRHPRNNGQSLSSDEIQVIAAASYPSPAPSPYEWSNPHGMAGCLNNPSSPSPNDTEATMSITIDDLTLAFSYLCVTSKPKSVAQADGDTNMEQIEPKSMEPACPEHRMGSPDPQSALSSEGSPQVIMPSSSLLFPQPSLPDNGLPRTATMMPPSLPNSGTSQTTFFVSPSTVTSTSSFQMATPRAPPHLPNNGSFQTASMPQPALTSNGSSQMMTSSATQMPPLALMNQNNGSLHVAASITAPASMPPSNPVPASASTWIAPAWLIMISADATITFGRFLTRSVPGVSLQKCSPGSKRKLPDDDVPLGKKVKTCSRLVKTPTAVTDALPSSVLPAAAGPSPFAAFPAAALTPAQLSLTEVADDLAGMIKAQWSMTGDNTTVKQDAHTEKEKPSLQSGMPVDGDTHDGKSKADDTDVKAITASINKQTLGGDDQPTQERSHDAVVIGESSRGRPLQKQSAKSQRSNSSLSRQERHCNERDENGQTAKGRGKRATRTEPDDDLLMDGVEGASDGHQVQDASQQQPPPDTNDGNATIGSNNTGDGMHSAQATTAVNASLTTASTAAPTTASTALPIHAQTTASIVAAITAPILAPATALTSAPAATSTAPPASVPGLYMTDVEGDDTQRPARGEYGRLPGLELWDNITDVKTQDIERKQSSSPVQGTLPRPRRRFGELAGEEEDYGEVAGEDSMDEDDEDDEDEESEEDRDGDDKGDDSDNEDDDYNHGWPTTSNTSTGEPTEDDVIRDGPKFSDTDDSMEPNDETAVTPEEMAATAAGIDLDEDEVNRNATINFRAYKLRQSRRRGRNKVSSPSQNENSYAYDREASARERINAD